MQKFTVNDPLALRRPMHETPQTNKLLSDVSYDADFALWLDRQIQMLRAGRFDAVDIDNVIEELESMGKATNESSQAAWKRS